MQGRQQQSCRHPRAGPQHTRYKTFEVPLAAPTGFRSGVLAWAEPGTPMPHHLCCLCTVPGQQQGWSNAWRQGGKREQGAPYATAYGTAKVWSPLLSPSHPFVHMAPPSWAEADILQLTTPVQVDPLVLQVQKESSESLQQPCCGQLTMSTLALPQRPSSAVIQRVLVWGMHSWRVCCGSLWHACARL